MHIYVVCEGRDIVGVFRNKEDASKQRKKMKHSVAEENRVMEGECVYDKSFDKVRCVEIEVKDGLEVVYILTAEEDGGGGSYKHYFTIEVLEDLDSALKCSSDIFDCEHDSDDEECKGAEECRKKMLDELNVYMYCELEHPYTDSYGIGIEVIRII